MTQANSFAYQAQTLHGQALAGTIDAASVDEAQRLLAGLRLRVLQIEPIARPQRAKPLSGDDFAAFNLQLAHLTKAGLPVEHGLRLIAQDIRRGRLKQTINQLAGEMEKGTPLDQAFEKFSDRFPPLYSRLVSAGIKSGDLPGVLLNLGRHIELVGRLRAALWRAASYPLMILGGLTVVVIFLGLVVIPQFRGLFKSLDVSLPWITRAILALPMFMPLIVALLSCVIVGLPLLWLLLKRMGHGPAVMDRIVMPMPLIGPVLRQNLVARWCDALRIGVQAGLDLPRAIELAGEVVGSPGLKRDGNELSAALESGRSLESVEHTRVLPATVAAALALSSANSDIVSTLGMLAEMYQQQAETRLAMVPVLLAPVLVLAVALIIGVIVTAMFLPFLQLLSNLM